MKEISVKEIFKKDMGSSEAISLEVESESLDIPESIVLQTLSGKGKLFRLEDRVVINAKFIATVGLICDRCLDNFETEVGFDLEREFLFDRKQESEYEEGYVDKYFNIDIIPAIREEFLLSIPSKNLCNKDCHGICATCGVSLNHEKCKCKN